jgi:hypothetical protein
MTWRLRSVVRTLALGLAVLVVLGLLASLALRLYGRQRLATARAAFEGQGFSLALDSYELPAVPKGENAAAWLEAGAAAIVWSTEDPGFALSPPGMSVGGDATRARKLRDLLEANHGAMETLHRADSLPRASFEIPYREGATARLPDLMGLRRASSLLLLQGRLALHDHDGEGVLASLRGLSRLADALTGESTLVMLLVGDAVEADALVFATEVVSDPSSWLANSGRLEELKAALPTTNRLAQLRRALAWEGAVAEAWLVRGGLFREAFEEATTHRARVLLKVTGFEPLTRAAVLEAALRQVTFLDASFPVLMAGAPRPASSPLFLPRFMAEMLTPSAVRAVLSVRLTLAERQLVRAALTLRAQGVGGRAYPPGRPTKAGLDEPNALTGLPLQYSLAADGSARLEIPGVTTEQMKGVRRNPVLGLGVSLPAVRAPQPGP